LPFSSAIAECLIEEAINPTTRVAKSLKKTPVGANDVPSLLRLQQDIGNFTSRVITKLASRCLALTTLPVGVGVGARWDEFEGIDWDQPELPILDPTWRIPAVRMNISLRTREMTASVTTCRLRRRQSQS